MEKINNYRVFIFIWGKIRKKGSPTPGIEPGPPG